MIILTSSSIVKILKYKLYTNEVKENENVGEENYDDDDEAEEDD